MKSKTLWIIIAAVALAALVYYFCWEDGYLSLPGSDTGGSSGGSGGGGYTGITPPATTISTVTGPAPNSNPALGTAGPGTGGIMKPGTKTPTRHL